MKEFKDIFVSLRKEKEYSQLDIAKMLNVSKSTVGMWELGQRMPQRATLESIADIFNVDMDYLCGRQEIKKKIGFSENGEMYVNVPEYDPDTIEIIDLLGKIKPEQKQTVLAMLRSFVN